MVDQNLVDWIKQQLNNGYDSNQVREMLISNGHEANNASEAINAATANNVNQPGVTDTNTTKQPDSKKLIILFIVATTVLGIALFGISNILSSGDEVQSFNMDQSAVPTTEITEPDIITTEQKFESIPTGLGCSDLPRNIAFCQEYSCEFTSQLIGEKVNREVKGLDGSTCLFEENFFDGGKLSCVFPESKLEEIALFYELILHGEHLTDIDLIPDYIDVFYYSDFEVDEYCTFDSLQDRVNQSGGTVVNISLSDFAAEDGSKGIFYKVSGGNSEMYLFGSIHFGREDMYPLHSKVMTAFGNSDVLVLEIDMTSLSMEDILMLSQMGTFDDPDERLSDIITEETFQRALEILEPYGFDRETLDTFKPWYLSTALTEIAFTDEPDSVEGIDEFFMELAMYGGMEIIGLEDLLSQIERFEILSEESQEIFLSNSLDEIDPDYDGINANDLIRIWKTGDVDEAADVKRTFIEESETESLRRFADSIITERDQELSLKLIDLLESDEQKRYFVVVGYMHLVGENSIPELLIEAGYDVEIVY